jgi:dethiobiotin synthetase
VGKTVVACALAAWCRAQGADVGVMKPVATGGRRLSRGARRVSDDAIRLAAAAGSSDPWALINPVCFEEPLAPWTAARRARRAISLSKLQAAYDALRQRHDVLIVEGVGGLLVPLTVRETVADVARRYRLPLVLVARPGLGTLNHTLLTLSAIRHAHLPCRGVVINAHTRPARTVHARLAERTNPEVLRRAGKVRVLGELPYVRGRAASALFGGGRAWRSLAHWAARHFDAQFLHSLLPKV